MALVLFLTCCALIVYAYVIYPILLCALAALFGRASHSDEAYTPTVSVLIPVFNEERFIAQKIENTLNLDYPKERFEVIVASESNDGTDAIVRGNADRGIRLLPSRVRLGKSANLKRAISEARGEILLFTDVAASLQTDALRKIMRHFADQRIGAVSGRAKYVNTDGTGAGESERLYWELEQILKWAGSRLFSLPGATGKLFAMRRSCYHPITEKRGDDFELAIQCILDGFGSILEPQAISVEKSTRGFLQVYRRKVRISNWMFGSALILVREAIKSGRGLLTLQLTQRIIRWMVPVWLIGAFVSNIALLDRGFPFQVLAAAQTLFYCLGIILLIVNYCVFPVRGWVAVPAYFMAVSAALLVGITACLFGIQMTWHKTRD